MALDFSGLMTVIGENVKKIDIFNTLISSLETYKDDIYTDMAAEGFQDQYVPLPAQFLSMKNAVSGWISTLISDVTTVLLEPDLVLDELSLYSYDVTSVLNGLYDYMDDNSETIETSVVTLGGTDIHQKAASATVGTFSAGTATTNGIVFTSDPPPVLFVSRILDGVNAPGNGVTAHIRYDGIESQLARSATITAEIVGNDTIGGETAQIYSPLTAKNAYLADPESPGVGPILTNPEADNVIATNYSFNAWTGNAPTGWTMSGTITTDYLDVSTTGAGPLRLNTQGITALQQISDLEHNRLYFLAVYSSAVANGDSDDEVIGLKIRTLGDSALITQVTSSVNNAVDLETASITYAFFTLPVTVDLTDVYVEVEYVTAGHANSTIDIRKVVCAPATYYNGLAWVFWPAYHLASNAGAVPLGHRTSIAISNNNNGKFQTFFRKAYNIQLPTADSPTVADSLAGG